MKLCAHTINCSRLWKKSWSGGLKMANKGKPKFPTFLEKNKIKNIKKWILMKSILSWRKLSQEFDGINEKSPNP